MNPQLNPMQEKISLTPDERGRLEQLEVIIECHVPGLLELGRALMEIRDSHLYREHYRTFKEYCNVRWGISRPRAYQAIEHVEVIKNLSTIVDKKDLPSECVTRTLGRYLPDHQLELWTRAAKIAGSHKITSAHITRARREWSREKFPPADAYDAYEVTRAKQNMRHLKSAWRRVTEEQRDEFLKWIASKQAPKAVTR